MTDAIEVALIVSVAPTLAAFSVGYYNYQRLKKIDKKADSIETKVDGGHTELLNALLKITASANFIAGGQAEKDKIKEV
jgi:pentose-5-phosphate-3-epimerase